MFGEIIAYSVGKAVARRRYKKKSNNQETRYCLGCSQVLNYVVYECHNIEDLCLECCQCTEHSD